MNMFAGDTDTSSMTKDCGVQRDKVDALMVSARDLIEVVDGGWLTACCGLHEHVWASDRLSQPPARCRPADRELVRNTKQRQDTVLVWVSRNSAINTGKETGSRATEV